jgi:AcrR family transcriptional regulator
VARSKPPNKPRKRPRQARSKFTVDAILEATERVLAERGLDDASTTEVAELAGVSVGTLYQYFPNKQALVAAVIERALARDREVLTAAFARAREVEPLGRALAELGASMHALYGDRTDLYREMVAAMGEVERARQIDALIADAVEMTAELLDARRAEHDHPAPRMAAWILIHTSVALLRAGVVDRPEQVRDGGLGVELRRLGGRYLGLLP